VSGLTPVGGVIAMNEKLARFNVHLEELIKQADRMHKALPAVSGPPGRGGDGGEAPPWQGEMPPWAFDFNQANNPNLTNGFEQPTKPEGGT
jgi:hypothetical protein